MTRAVTTVLAVFWRQIAAQAKRGGTGAAGPRRKELRIGGDKGELITPLQESIQVEIIVRVFLIVNIGNLRVLIEVDLPAHNAADTTEPTHELGTFL